MRGIREEDPQSQFQFWGGDLMVEVGGEQNLKKHYRESSFFGLFEVVRNIGTISRQLKECKQSILDFEPDVVILIDYPGFNMKIARFAHEHNIKVYYYIAPKVWASREGRLKGMRKYIDELFIIFPFERGYFASKGIDTHFMGNPLVDALAQRVKELPSREEFLQRNGLNNRAIVALLVGSRVSEIKANLGLMREVAESFPDYQFVVAGVDWIAREEYDKYIAGSSIEFVCSQTYELLSVSEAALVTSGTATLETALLNVPEVVVYRLSRFFEFMKPYVLKIPYISLVNINLGRESVREIVQASHDSTPAREALASILEGGDKRKQMFADFDELRELIGGEGASRRFAKKMVELLQK